MIPLNKEVANQLVFNKKNKKIKKIFFSKNLIAVVDPVISIQVCIGR